MSTDTTTTPLTEKALAEFAVAWYQALDRHDDIGSVETYLVPDDLEFVLPETTTHGLSGFEGWYDAVTHKFFDEVHEVTGTEARDLTPESATLKVVVRWQASKWEAPGPRSERLDFHAEQTWDVVASPTGPRIRKYAVDVFDPNPGSASL